MKVGATSTSLPAVKSAFEANYACMGITCADVGNLYNADANTFFTGISQCVDTSPLNLDRIAGYLPGTNVVDHSLIDLDQKAIEEQIKVGTAESFNVARKIYEEGGHSKSFAEITLDTALVNPVNKGTSVIGESADGAWVYGSVMADYESNTRDIKVQYTVDADNSRVCYVGGLPSDKVDTSGCLMEVGSITISGQGAFNYQANNQGYNKNARAIQGFSTAAQSKMYEDCPGCPYKDFKQYYDYYGEFDYANKWILAAAQGSSTSFKNGNADFTSYDFIGRGEAFKKGTAYMSVWMYVIRELEDAIDDCNVECTFDCNEDAVHAWDEAVAFYAGSEEGSDGSGDGALLYSLADKRCANFGTCGAGGDSVEGVAKTNLDIYAQFAAGQMNLNLGKQ
mmetsp:Transcript_6671/g.8857  ORF Transcript_6671/g.8857 Transcript_6671/m.8857 type:complete len:395 (+) Transcript_6671:2-1186(+)